MKSDPINKVKAWMEQARNTEKSDADAISLATIDEMGFPNVRMVLLRKIEADSFVFFTNYTSKKAKEIEFSNKVAFSFHWKSLAKLKPSDVQLARLSQFLEEFIRRQNW